MKDKGLEIEYTSKGLFIDGKRYRQFEKINDFTKVFSDYFFFDVWQDKELDASQGELSPHSMFLFISSSAPMPCCIGYNRFSYFDDPKFGAGYLKYIALGLLACDVLLEDHKYKRLYLIEMDGEEIFKLPDIDEIINICLENNYDRCEMIEKIRHIIRLCNMIFYEQDKEKQKGYLMYAANKFNEYFENAIEDATGWNYEFKVYDGANVIKDRLIDYCFADKQNIADLFEKSEWNTQDKNTVQRIIDTII